MPPPVIIRNKGPRFATGDLWRLHTKGCWVVVTTNIGWKSDGANVMGAGVAKQAAERFPDLPLWYGTLCRKYREEVGAVLYNPGRLVLIPTKPLNRVAPQLSWQQDSSLELVEQSVLQLAQVLVEERFTVAMGYPGCGNGNLQVAKVKPMLLKHLANPKVIIVEPS